MQRVVVIAAVETGEQHPRALRRAGQARDTAFYADSFTQLRDELNGIINELGACKIDLTVKQQVDLARS